MKPTHSLLIFALVAFLAHAAPTGLLNDTGQTSCYDASNTAVACSVGGVGSDAGTNPRQDGRYGRDPQAAAGKLTKTGGGAAGFDFTALDDAVYGSAVATGTHTCVKDNRTQLIWSTQTVTGTAWADTAATAYIYSRCNLQSGWRVPTAQELLTIVHNGVSGPAIDTTYFPGTSSANYWTADAYVPDAANAWSVDFANGGVTAGGKTDAKAVRFVCDDACSEWPAP